MIFLKNKNEIKDIDRACKIVRDTLFHIEEYIVLDVPTIDLDRIAEEYIISKGAIPGFKGLYVLYLMISMEIMQKLFVLEK